LQAGVKHIILAVSYRAEMLEKELKVEEERVSDCSVVVFLFCLSHLLLFVTVLSKKLQFYFQKLCSYIAKTIKLC